MARLRTSTSGSKLAATAEDGSAGSGGGLTAAGQLIRALSLQSSDGHHGDGNHVLGCACGPCTTLLRPRVIRSMGSFCHRTR